MSNPEMSASLESHAQIFFNDLVTIARSCYVNRGGLGSLGASDLVQEVFLRLWRRESAGNHCNSPNHLFRTAKLAMRQIVMNQIARRSADCRKPRGNRVSLSELHEKSSVELINTAAILEAFERLEEHSPIKSKLALMLIFGGLTLPEAAKELSVSLPTAERHWRMAKAWLRCELKDVSLDTPFVKA